MVLQLGKPLKKACFAGCAQTNATPPTDKIHPFSKIAVPFELVMQFGCP